MRDNTVAVLKAGIVPDSTVEEISRWNRDLPEVNVSDDPDIVIDEIVEAVEGPDSLELRLTDLDALVKFSKSKQEGRLYYNNNGKTSFTNVEFMVDVDGSYLIPWTDNDSIVDFMLDEDTYLKPTGGECVYFCDAQEMFYGNHKVFLVCRKA